MVSPDQPVLRAAVVGAGNIAGSHVRGLLEARERLGRAVELVGVVDVDAERAAAFAERHGIPATYDDMAAMLGETTPDLVHLCTPPGSHVEQAITCLQADAHVLCEKPPCLSLAEYDRILAAEQNSAGTFNVVYQHRFGSSGRQVKSLLDDGSFGRVFVAQCVTTWFRDKDYYAVPWRGSWDTEGGGPTMGHGIHQIDLLGHLLGDWAEVRAMTARLDRPVETEDVSVAAIRFADGAVASILNSVLSPRQESYLRLDAEKASIELTHLYGYQGDSWRITPAPGTEALATEDDAWALPDPDVPSSHAAQITALLRALDEGHEHETNGRTARRTLELIAAIYAAASTGTPIEPADLGPDSPFYHRMDGGVRREGTGA